MSAVSGEPVPRRASNGLLAAFYAGLGRPCPLDGDRVAAFDWKGAGVRARYVLCLTPRSGSTWLSHLLASTGLCGRPAEFFNDDMIATRNRPIGAASFPEYFDAIVRSSTTASTFGFAIDFYRMRWLAEIVDLEAVFLAPGTRFVALFRRDRLAQAISILLAIESGVWHRLRDGSPFGPDAQPIAGPPRPVDDLGDGPVWGWAVNLALHEGRWERFFERHGVSPLRMSYEDLVAGSREHVLRVLAHVTVPPRDSDVIVARVSALVDATRRLAGETSWRIASRFRLRYPEALERLDRLRSPEDVEAFVGELRDEHGITVELWR